MAQNYVFRVRGRGPFPVDMLRRDECWPVDSESAAAIAEPESHREVRLATARGYGPTAGRWASFGWMVQEVTGYEAAEEPEPPRRKRPRREPMQPGTVLAWRTLKATVIRDDGGDSFLVERGPNDFIRWQWESGGDTCRIIAVPEQAKPRQARNPSIREVTTTAYVISSGVQFADLRDAEEAQARLDLLDLLTRFPKSADAEKIAQTIEEHAARLMPITAALADAKQED